MNILILTQYYPPESVGAAIWVSDIVDDLNKWGHNVKVLTAFPNYPVGEVYQGYQGKVFQQGLEDDIEVTRSWIYHSPSKGFWSRVLSFFSFTISSLLAGLFSIREVDVIYTILQPLSLGPVAVWLGKKLGAEVVLNVQDIHPYAAIQMGQLKNPVLIPILEKLELWNYNKASRIVVISEGFKKNLREKGVPEEKITVVPNWADPDFIQPGPKLNRFREEMDLGDDFTIIYSGGLTHNSNLEPVIQAAGLLKDELYRFMIVGDGVRKPDLMQMAQDLGLEKLQFVPFQPLERYPEVLRAADISLVTLSSQAAYASVPSKIFKYMASGRPVLAITAEGNEVDRMIREGGFGLQVDPDDPQSLAEKIRWAAAHPAELDQMGRSGRAYLEANYSREYCIKRIEESLGEVVGNPHNQVI